MCGIAGFTRFYSGTGTINTLLQMGDAIAHRGPDAHGEYLDENVGLCHRRLSIIDLSEAGNQPMFSDDENLVLVFNGEIYNFQTLRQELEKKGYPFKTQTDSEVILALYKFEGSDFIKKINGMFALALWDKQAESLFIARDRIGKKPLYYFQDSKRFIFASEIKAILTLPDIPRVIRPDAVYDFFAYQYIPDPKTIFNNIHKLEPGHTLTITRSGVEKCQYWDISFKNKLNSFGDNNTQIANDLLKRIEDSVVHRMISDVPLGAFLSGGVDSSGVVGLMANNSESPVTTCSIGFNSEKFDEVEFAKEVAEQYHTNHHELTVQDNVANSLEEIVKFFDEPFADPSLVPTYYVSKLARKKVTVALAGDGGDENFAGYSKYTIDATENAIRNKFPLWIRKHLFPPLAKILSHGKSTLATKATTLLTTLSHDPAYGFYLTNSFFRDSIWKKVIRRDYLEALNNYHPSSVTTECYKKADGDDHLSKILYTDIKTYLPGDILVKVDRMSMAHSLEVRAPLLDYQIVEYAATIPSHLKLKGKDKKHILKQSFSNLLSDDILHRKKMGFSVPLAQWLRNEIKALAETTIFTAAHGLPDYFVMSEVKNIWNKHQSGTVDYSSELWSMLMFQLWYNRYAANSSGVTPS